MTVKIGAITIGQSPRDDVVPEIKEITGSNIEIIEYGALDELSLEQIKLLKPQKSDRVLVTRMRDGTSVTIAEKHIVPRIQYCIEKIEAEIDLIAMLCTGAFPKLNSRRIILRLDKIMKRMVEALLEKGSIGVVTPIKEQILQTRKKWERENINVIVNDALPYSKKNQVIEVAKRFVKNDVDLIILDCIGFNKKMKKIVYDITKKPVILPRTLLARTILELVA